MCCWQAELAVVFPGLIVCFLGYWIPLHMDDTANCHRNGNLLGCPISVFHDCLCVLPCSSKQMNSHWHMICEKKHKGKQGKYCHVTALLLWHSLHKHWMVVCTDICPIANSAAGLRSSIVPCSLQGATHKDVPFFWRAFWGACLLSA